MDAMRQSLESSLTGNILKAILCVRKIPKSSGLKGEAAVRSAAISADSLQKKLLQSTEKALASGSRADFRSLTGVGGPMAGSGYLAMEVQYNPSTLHMETQAGVQVDYGGGSLGGRSSNQIVRTNQPVSTTLGFQLVFDDMNPQDAFALENMAPTAGNLVSGSADLMKKARKQEYSVQTQMDGIMSLLTQDETRQVIFYWAKLCFCGELVSVESRYTMFNKSGNPIRGTVDLSIRQGNEPVYGYDESYWDQAFTKAFGKMGMAMDRGAASTFQKATNNHFLNLDL